MIGGYIVAGGCGGGGGSGGIWGEWGGGGGLDWIRGRNLGGDKGWNWGGGGNGDEGGDWGKKKKKTQKSIKKNIFLNLLCKNL